MKRFISFIMIVLVLAAGIAIGFALAKWGTPSSGGNAGSSASGVTSVQTTPVRLGKIAQSITVYGTVAANPALEKSLSVAFESRVVKVFVVKGQKVLPNQRLLQIQASPAERLKLAEAKNHLKIATMQLRLAKAELKLQLATQADLIAARDAQITASLRLASLQGLGVGKRVTLRAPDEAVVVNTPAVPGKLEPLGAVLINLLPINKMRVALRVPPTNLAQLRLGQIVKITVSAQGHELHESGKISLITGRIDPISGLVSVYVTPSKPGGLVIGQYASGRLRIASSTGLIVPHSAVLPINGQENMYTIKGTHAVVHHVKIGLSNDREVEVSARGLRAGEPVVIVGNAELTDGMAVKQRKQP